MTRHAVKPLLTSRERAIGVSGKRLAASTQRSLDSIRERIKALFGPWAEIDNSATGATVTA